MEQFVIEARKREQSGTGAARAYRREGFVPGVVYGQGQDTTPIALATALWNHGEEMMDALAKAGIEWPMLSGPEVVDLLAYLRSRG